MTERTQRVILGFLVAPFLALQLATVVSCLGLGTYNPSAEGPLGACLASTAPLLLLFGSLVAYPVAAVLGVPLYLLLRRLGWLKWWQVAIAATVVGAMVAVATPLFTESTMRTAIDYLPLFGGIGLVAGIIFWFAALWKARSNSVLESDARQTTPRAPQHGR